VLRCTNRWHLLAPALVPASSRWVPLLGGARVRHIALAARAEKGASANAPALSVSCSPGAYYLPRRDRDRDVPARVALLRWWMAWPAAVARVPIGCSVLPGSRRGAGAVERGGLEMRLEWPLDSRAAQN
jgi:hypothetical protein